MAPHIDFLSFFFFCLTVYLVDCSIAVCKLFSISFEKSAKYTVVRMNPDLSNMASI